MHKQRGMTFIGLVLTIAIIVFVAVIAMKLVPAYIEYFSVKKAITKISNDPSFNQMGKNEIVASFDRTASIDYITVISGKDLTVEKDEAGKTVVSADYQALVPLVGNVSALLDFSVSTDDTANAVAE
jgi:Tfp pilus assembly major pilin PilA